jgi:hypothetical protein
VAAATYSVEVPPSMPKKRFSRFISTPPADPGTIVRPTRQCVCLCVCGGACACACAVVGTGEDGEENGRHERVGESRDAQVNAKAHAPLPADGLQCHEDHLPACASHTGGRLGLPLTPVRAPHTTHDTTHDTHLEWEEVVEVAQRREEHHEPVWAFREMRRLLAQTSGGWGGGGLRTRLQPRRVEQRWSGERAAPRRWPCAWSLLQRRRTARDEDEHRIVSN